MTTPDSDALALAGDELLAAILDRLDTPRSAFAVPGPLAIGWAPVVSGGYDLMGLMAYGSANAAYIEIADGGPGGIPLFAFNVASYADRQFWFGPDGIEVNSGLFSSLSQPLAFYTFYLRHKRAGRATDA